MQILLLDYMVSMFLTHTPNFVLIIFLFNPQNHLLYIILKYKNLKKEKQIVAYVDQMPSSEPRDVEFTYDYHSDFVLRVIFFPFPVLNSLGSVFWAEYMVQPVKNTF